MPIRGAKVWPGLVTKATIPNKRAEAACFLRFKTKSSSTKSVTTRFSNLQVPSVKTRLLWEAAERFQVEARGALTELGRAWDVHGTVRNVTLIPKQPPRAFSHH